MADDIDDDRPIHRSAIPATGALHTIHAAIGTFPLAYFLVALITDYAYSQSGNIFWSGFASWMIFGGLVAAGLSIVIGLIEWLAFRHHPGVHRTEWHALITLVAFAVGIVDAMVHARDGWVAVVPTGITLTAITFILLLIGSVLAAFETVRTREVRA
ncbi:DUF2231 domain-containing protein [Sphingomonas sp.]|uniref:DUF2231 domain-containing protein n=1 Tax=Sphingomonas sp. TaxID=28214 RepID=UPI0025F8EF52|nr:DUF2231 domain-containing protein [Sphingomonas sp.]MBV9527650.1 DUF2231 domain-containing protein [Sphingomonas sp.]